MRRFLPLLIIFSLVMPACSGTGPAELEVRLPVASSSATSMPSLLQSPVVPDTPTSTSVAEPDVLFTTTPAISLTATPTLTPTLTTSSNLTTDGISTQPPQLSTPMPKKPLFLNEKRSETRTARRAAEGASPPADVICHYFTRASCFEETIHKYEPPYSKTHYFTNSLPAQAQFFSCGCVVVLAFSGADQPATLRVNLFHPGQWFQLTLPGMDRPDPGCGDPGP